MIHTQQLSHSHSLSRRVLMIAQSEELYKVHVEISGIGRSELSYQFIPSLHCDIQQAQDLAVDRATRLFLGYKQEAQEVVQTVMQIETAIKQEVKQEKEDAKQKTEPEKSGEKVSKKVSKKSKQEEVKSEPQKEEMEEVESPYNAARKSSAIPYDRDDKASTASFASYITRLHNGSKEWKKVEGLKEFSMSLHGQPFLEKNGDIVPEFAEKCKAFFAVEEDEASL